ncbi:hypothetical protein C5167_019725 [Papaver somniferum]|uniref:Saccharopine dehydrogenase NADP binding domain-containing protein n=1 Tax=Papaver somniferum TaxID=3469 RepID=A0A4Y7IU34_PAPSO|nr:hypothetical protein C5167_019725 [Papaver somniferum]
MVEAHYDLVILGASGFTGKYVVKEALKYLHNSISPTSPLKTIALAGRNPAKLEEALKWALSNYHHGFENTSSSILIIKADVSDPSSLRDLCSKTKLILNCVGPFSLYGEPVVSACIEVGCDYLDVCGEPEFMERMEAINHHKAVENGSLVISACAFQSAIAEMVLMFHSQQWLSPAVPNQVEVYMSVESNKRIVVNFGSLRSSLLIVSNAEKLLELRKSRPKIATPMIPGPLLKDH